MFYTTWMIALVAMGSAGCDIQDIIDNTSLAKIEPRYEKLVLTTTPPKLETLTPSKVPRMNQCFERSGSMLYMMGGTDSLLRQLDTVESLDLTTGAFTTGAPWPTPRFTVISVDAAGRVCMGYGTLNFNVVDPIEVIDCYDTQTNTWSTLPPLPGKLNAGAHPLASHGGDIYAFGVADDMGLTKAVFVHEDAKGAWRQLPPMPEFCQLDHPLTIGDKVYLFDCGVDKNQKMLLAYDVVAETWSTLAPPPAGDVFVSYGERPHAYKNGFVFRQQNTHEVWRYDITADQWSKGPPMPVDTARATSAIVDTKLYVRVLGTKSGPATGSIHAYDIETQTWSIALDLPANKGNGFHAEAVGSEIHYIGEYSELAPSIGQ